MGDFSWKLFWVFVGLGLFFTCRVWKKFLGGCGIWFGGLV